MPTDAIDAVDATVTNNAASRLLFLTVGLLAGYLTARCRVTRTGSSAPTPTAVPSAVRHPAHPATSEAGKRAASVA